MAYLHCARCGLQIKIHAPFLSIENCPRCLVRTAIVSPMTLSSSSQPATQGSDAQRAPETRRAAATRRANQGVLATAVRALRSQQRPRDTL